MLCKLSLRNIRRSMKDYTVYFFTLIIGISVFYIFNAIGTQMSFLRLSDDSGSIAELLTTLISGMSVFVAIVLHSRRADCVFVWLLLLCAHQTQNSRISASQLSVSDHLSNLICFITSRISSRTAPFRYTGLIFPLEYWSHVP